MASMLVLVSSHSHWHQSIAVPWGLGDLDVLADGKIVAAGAANYFGPDAKFAVVRLDSEGALDSDFSGDGKVTTNLTTGRDGAWSMAIQEDGSIVASGYAGWQRAKFALVRYLST